MDGVTLPQVAVYVTTVSLAILAPGPAIVACTHAALSRGRERTMPFALGLAIGASLWCLLALFGLSVLFRVLPQLFVALKVAGGLYLLWVALRMWRRAPEPLPEAASAGPGFWSGVALNLSNPKPALFYGAVLLSIFPRLEGWVAPGVVYAISLACEATFYSLVATLMAAGPMRRGYFGAKTVIDRVAASTIGALGLTLIIRH